MSAAKKIKPEDLPTWDLSALYPGKDSPELKKDLSDVKDRVRRFEKLFGNSIKTLDGDVLGSAIKEYEEIEETLGRLSSFAYLLYSENISDTQNASFYQNISEKVNDISSNLLFFTLEINKLDEDELQEKLQAPNLARYAPWIRDIRAFKDHQLSDEVEKILHEKSLTSRQSWHRLFEETLADMRFDLNGEELTCAEILNNMSSKDADLRKASAKSIGKTLGAHIKTFAHITNTLAKDKEIDDKWRNFARPISSRNLNNLIEDEVTEALIKTVRDNYANLSHRYYKIKAKWFGQETLAYWDRNAPLPSGDDRIIPWAEAVDIVLKAYHDFCPAMGNIGKRFFMENWIDAPARKGKDSGAYSHPTVPGAHPYILMNYQGKTRDVMTLAHELGHGVHQVLSAGQGALMADTPLTLAETASVFGEQLTFRALLEQQGSEEKRKNMIASKVEDMLNTVVRQIAFCSFEQMLHDERRKGEVSADRIGEIWMQVQGESLGPAITFEDEYKHYWAYIPHFVHTPFYVYAYAFGDCLVNSLYRVYQQHPEGFQDKYVTLLKAGGTLRHKELLAPFNLDASDPTFWQGGLDMIAEFIDELEG